MTYYESLDIICSVLNILLFIFLSITFQKNFSNETKVKEMLIDKLEKIKYLIGNLDYSKDLHREYLLNKRTISNMLNNMNQKKIYKYIKECKIKELKKIFEELSFSLEDSKTDVLKFKEDIYRVIEEIEYSLYGL
jgi:hypothetical protein|nr:MAG TPA: hypothetical protein [Caudoviricetes sp.]